QCVRSLRQHLQSAFGCAVEAILATRTGIGLNPDLVGTDVARFEALIARSKKSGTTARERAALLSQAVELYRGELLPGFYLDNIVWAKERLAEAHLEALRVLTRDLEELGEFDPALKYARKVALLDPASEAACIALMRLCAASGQPAEVLRSYQEFE